MDFMGIFYTLFNIYQQINTEHYNMQAISWIICIQTLTKAENFPKHATAHSEMHTEM